MRFHRMKERFGIDPQFPIARYVDGFTKLMVPDREGEHTQSGNVVGPYLGTPKCTNPLFAASLPSAQGDETLQSADRTARQGPRRLRGARRRAEPARRFLRRTGRASSARTPRRSTSTGIDPHMIQSVGAARGTASSDEHAR